MDKREQRAVVSDFIKAFSCSYSMTRNLGRVLGVEEDPLLLQSVIGFGSGVATMGDTCGAVNGGVALLGKRFPDMPSVTFYSLCSDYFGRIEARSGTPNCGRVHGGRDMVPEFRRALLTGKTRGCTAILKEASEVLDGLASEVLNGNYREKPGIEAISRHFEKERFHCSQSVIHNVAERIPMPVERIDHPARGFCGGTGFNGTLCGAIAGGVLCLGLKAGVDLRHSGYGNTARILLYGLVRGGGVFRDEKV
ncbi:MAG: C-GCAxxG-C-C family (seleno)protein, partial [Dehalococcoidia bacterium]